MQAAHARCEARFAWHLLGLVLVSISSVLSSAAWAEPLELKYQFSKRGKPYIHGFTLTWSSPESNLQTITVTDPENGTVVQKIMVPQDKIKLNWKNIQTANAKETRESIFDQNDYNFDRFADFRLLREFPGKLGNKLYLIYTFDKKKNQYILNEEMSSLPSLSINTKSKLLESTTLGGFGGFESTTQFFSVTPFGQLVLEARVESKVTDAFRMTIQKDVLTQQQGQLKLICQWTEEPEGSKRQILGTPDLCGKYWTPLKPKMTE